MAPTALSRVADDDKVRHLLKRVQFEIDFIFIYVKLINKFQITISSGKLNTKLLVCIAIFQSFEVI